jgi:amidohydrolase
LTLEEAKQQVIAEVDALREGLVGLARRLFAHPEVGFQEEQASAWLCQYLEGHGFQVERGIYGLDTAFRAAYGGGQPTIAFLAEYDALPGLGHGCGHNLIAASAAGAGVAIRPAVEQWGGRVLVVGTPSEEALGGKGLMVQAGAFEGVDAAMMVHPGVRDALANASLACATLDVEFLGRPAHAAARPEEGVNALEAMVLAFQAINSLRQHIRDSDRIHGIITHGGEAANVVPQLCAGRFLVRATEEEYLEGLKERVLNCFRGAATASGARLNYRWGEVQYAPMRPNLVLGQAFADNLAALGRPLPAPNLRRPFGSTDMGNVSQVVPAIHPSIAITAPEVPPHSREFAQAASSPQGEEAMLLGAKGMAMTAVDLLAAPGLLEKVRQEFGGAGSQA